MNKRSILASALLLLLVATPCLANSNTSLSATVNIPEFSEFTIEPSQPEVGDPVDVTVKVHKKDSVVTAYMTHPDGTVSNKIMNTTDSITYNATLNTSAFGTHTVKIAAENSQGTSTVTKKISTKIFLSNSTSVKKGNTTNVLNTSHTSINATANETDGEATINATISTQPDGIGLKEVNRTTGGSDKAIKYLNITSNLKNISRIRIDIRYTEEEIKEVDEGSLSIFYYNGTRWFNCNNYVNSSIPKNPLVFEAGNDPDRNYAYVVVNETSQYSLGGNYSPPSPVSELKTDSRGFTQIKWSWTDPQIPDLSHIEVYIDGEFKGNVSKGTQNYLVKELSPDSGHTISTRTVDTTGLLSSWNNDTARTSVETATGGGGGGGGGGSLPILTTPTPTPTGTAEKTPTRSIPSIPSTPANIETATGKATEFTPTPTPSPEAPKEMWWQQPTLTITLTTVVIVALVILLYAVRRE